MADRGWGRPGSYGVEDRPSGSSAAPGRCGPGLGRAGRPGMTERGVLAGIDLRAGQVGGPGVAGRPPCTCRRPGSKSWITNRGFLRAGAAMRTSVPGPRAGVGTGRGLPGIRAAVAGHEEELGCHECTPSPGAGAQVAGGRSSRLDSRTVSSAPRGDGLPRGLVPAAGCAVQSVQLSRPSFCTHKAHDGPGPRER